MHADKTESVISTTAGLFASYSDEVKCLSPVAVWQQASPVCTCAKVIPPSIGINGLSAFAWLFLPATGYRNNSSFNNQGSNGNYWSSTLNADNPNNAYNLNFNSSNANVNNNNRYNGYTVRAVQSTCHS